MICKNLKRYLDNHNVRYVVIMHSPAYTAQEIAAVTHIPGNELAKTVMVNIDGKMAMVVLPSSLMVDFTLLKKATGADDVDLATEAEFKYLFPDCETGAMPPFGNLYDMEVFVAEKLTEDVEISFNAGTHSELIRMSYTDYERLAHPKVLKLSTQYA